MRRDLLPFDADVEKREMSVEYIHQRVDDGAHPLLEMRALVAHDSQILHHFLETLVAA